MTEVFDELLGIKTGRGIYDTHAKLEQATKDFIEENLDVKNKGKRVTVLRGCLTFFSSFFQTVARFAIPTVLGIGIKNEFITRNDLIFCLIYIAILAGAKGNLAQNKQDEIKAITAEESLFEAFNIQPELKNLCSDDFADDAQNYPQFLG